MTPLERGEDSGIESCADTIQSCRLRIIALRQRRRTLGRRQRRKVDRQISELHGRISNELLHQLRPEAAERHRRLSFLYGRWHAPLPLSTRMSHALRPCSLLHAIAVRGYEYAAIVKSSVPVLAFAGLTFARQPTWMLRIGRAILKTGFTGLRTEYRVMDYLHAVGPRRYSGWIRAFDTLQEEDRAAIRLRIDSMVSRPLISIIMPVCDTPESLLKQAINSVVSQLYPNWELCIADDASGSPQLRKVLQHYQAADRRIRCTYRETRGNISAASNSALDLASGDFVTFLDHDDELAEHALYMVAEELNRYPHSDVLYSDEDRLDSSGRRADPYFKTDWNPDLMLSHNMVCHLMVIRRQVVEAAGRFRTGFEGSQDHDLILRCAEQTVPEKIRHLPAVLYHWRHVPGSVSDNPTSAGAAAAAGAQAVREHLARRKIDATVDIDSDHGSPHYRVRYRVADPPVVSVIIPTRNRVELLRRCVDGLLKGTDYPKLEVIIVDNESDDADTLQYLNSLPENSAVRVVEYEGEFNYSAINNHAVRQARGEVICLLNNDTEIMHRGWLGELVSHAVRDCVGAVGAKLLFPDDSIQHAGVLIGYRGAAGHAFAGLPVDAPIRLGRANVVQDVSCVTAACMVLRKSIYDEVGGFDEKDFAVRYNDVDFCLRLCTAGYRIVWTPYAQLYHHESASIRQNVTGARREQDLRELGALQQKWTTRILNDPHLNPNISIEHLDYRPGSPPRTIKPWR